MRNSAAWGVAGLCLLVVSAQLSAGQTLYPSLDGSGNNKQHPLLGAANTPYIRYPVSQTAYGTNSTNMAGSNRPSPRAITLALTNTPYFKMKTPTNTSYLLTALGQLISQDIGRVKTADPSSNGGSAPIVIPVGDPLYATFNSDEQPVPLNSRQSLPYTRSAYIVDNNGTRQQINTVTAFLDASVLYGQDSNISRLLRAGTAGRLLDDGQRGLPLNVDPDTGLPKTNYMKNQAGRVPATQLRLSGNSLVNQNPLLLVLITVLLREHNRRANILEARNPDWGDEQLFQEARKWVIAHFQRIALVDYMTGLGIPLPPYTGYNMSINPGTDNFFSTVAYRYGHATIKDVILRLDSDWSEHPKGHLPLMQTYYNPSMVLDAGIGPLIRGLLVLPQAAIEARWASSISGNLMGMSTVNGTDLPAINIQRGRDHGIPDYNTCRRLFGLQPVKSFQELSPDDPQVAEILQNLYGNISNVDAYVGGLAEPHYLQGHVGELFYKSIYDQFFRLREGDWWYYENFENNRLFTAQEVEEIQATTLRDLILRNTDIKDLPGDIWTAISPGTCPTRLAADGGSNSNSSGSQDLLVNGLLANSAQLHITPGSQSGWIKVLVTAAGAGWLGFGVSIPDSPSAMIGADMVVGRMVDGQPVVKRYHAVDHAPPEEASEQSTADRVKLINFQQANGQVSMEFERPMAASSDAANDGTQPVPLDKPMRFIVARGPSNDFGSFANYHGLNNREPISVPQLFASGAVVTDGGDAAATQSAISKRRTHGILMVLNFIVVMPLGALAARQLRCHWLKVPAIRAALFYVHVATQVTGVVIATVGFVIATRMFNVPYNEVMWSHGKVGIAILTLVYSQLLVGFCRPVASGSPMRRHIWDVVHVLLGRTAMLLGVMNVILGITIFTRFYQGDLAVWGGLSSAALIAISLLQYMLDRQEKYVVLRDEQELVAGHLENKDLDHNPSDATGGLRICGSDVEHARASGNASGNIVRKLTASTLKQHDAASAEAGGSADGDAVHDNAAVDYGQYQAGFADAADVGGLNGYQDSYNTAGTDGFGGFDAGGHDGYNLVHGNAQHAQHHSNAVGSLGYNGHHDMAQGLPHNA